MAPATTERIQLTTNTSVILMPNTAMHRPRDPEPNTNCQPHNHRPNRNLNPKLGARIQPPHGVPALRPSLLRQLRLFKRLLAGPYRALVVSPRGLLLRQRELAAVEAGAGLGLGQSGLEVGFVGAQVGLRISLCGLLGEGGGRVVVVEGGEGGGGAGWGEGEDGVDVFDCVEGLLLAGRDGEADGEA